MSPIAPNDEAFRKEVRKVLPYLLAGPILGIACVGIYALAEGGLLTFGVGLLVGVAALLSGGLLGFLFAVPRTGTTDNRSRRFTSNSNLEQISDWLTKILVGLGLAQFNRVIDASRVVVDNIASALGSHDSSATFAACDLAIFSASGFLGVYVLTRIYLGPVFAQSEEAMEDFVQALVNERVADIRAGGSGRFEVQ